jgi:hypothetical protein
MGPKNSKAKSLGAKTIARHKSVDALEDLNRLYKIDSVPIAKGAFGHVYKACSNADPDTLFAMKHLIITNMTSKKINEISTEVEILNALDHP